MLKGLDFFLIQMEGTELYCRQILVCVAERREKEALGNVGVQQYCVVLHKMISIKNA
jgi:hypothetical protein